ncbi:serine/threonine kinase-like domain-containing protein STKLD1 [Suncus etruscus]|uniref:serine/threonine kinase-like domain-containing protein STKLD1 n=1 Tax=Suncus etruscus TaxID=109475 RepID=UPI002110B87D|nr:serine/threonine kinase-like domain-containing protein STKLD1 [Suncus etruscus]
MEKYQILYQLPPGALGVNVVVQNQRTQEKLLMKQVQCMDEHHASQALKELTPLLRLHHAHVSLYQDLFIVWKNEISALFLCLVSDYRAETFQSVIDRHRDAKAAINPEWLQEMLGQVLDGLEYLHHQGLIHRNLKPSNIALETDHHCQLQDLSSQALMTEKAKWTIRAEEDPVNRSWMAPEALDFTFTAKSDIWALGCIILDLVTCSFLGREEALVLRKSIHTQPENLQDALTAIEKRGIPDIQTFCSLLSPMLKIDPEDRINPLYPADLMHQPIPLHPNMHGLCGDPCTVHGREVIRMALMSGRFRTYSLAMQEPLHPLPISSTDMLLQGNTASILGMGSPGQVIRMDIPVLGCGELVINFPNQPTIQFRALRTLLTVPENKLGVPWPAMVVDVVASLMKQHERLLAVQLCGCSVLLRVLGLGLMRDPEARLPCSSFLCSVLMSLLERHGEEQQFLKLLHSILTIMVSQGPCRLLAPTVGTHSMLIVPDVKGELLAKELQEAGLLQHILVHLHHFSKSRDLCLSSLNLLWVLLANVVLVEVAALQQAVGIVMGVLRTFPGDGDITETSCAVLWLLALHGCVKEPQLESLVTLFLKSIRLGQGRTLLVMNACRGLACLARESELAALKVLQEGGGLALIRDTYERNKEDPALVETLCLLLGELMAHKEAAWELAHSGLEILAQEIKGRFTSSLEVVAMAEEVIQRLREVETTPLDRNSF